VSAAADTVGEPAPRRHLALGASFSLLAQLGPMGALAILSVVVGRMFGPVGNGELSLLTATLEITTMIAGLGLMGGITYYVSHGRWSARKAGRDTLRAAGALGVAGAAGALIVYAITRDDALSGVSGGLFLISVAAVPFMLTWQFVGAIALGRERYEPYAAFQVLQAFTLLVVGVALAFPLDLEGVVIGLLASHVAGALFAAYWIARYSHSDVDRAARGRPGIDEGGELRKAVSFGLRSWSANLMQVLNYRLDLYILAAVAGNAELGVYAVALAVTGLGWLLPSALEVVLFPRTATLDAAVRSGTLEGAQSDAPVISAARHTVLLLLPTALLLAAFLVVGVPLLYGPRFADTVSLGLILLPGVVGLGLAKVLSAVFTGRGFPQYALYATMISVPVTILLYAVLIPPLGATGAAIASCGSYLLTTGLSMYFFRLATGIPLRVALRPGRTDISDYGDALRRIRTIARDWRTSRTR
jgi:O-antigen/teichoic acid export membrane protein